MYYSWYGRLVDLIHQLSIWLTRHQSQLLFCVFVLWKVLKFLSLALIKWLTFTVKFLIIPCDEFILGGFKVWERRLKANKNLPCETEGGWWAICESVTRVPWHLIYHLLCNSAWVILFPGNSSCDSWKTTWRCRNCVCFNRESWARIELEVRADSPDHYIICCPALNEWNTLHWWSY